jgi:hypothetical protein
MSVRYMIGTVAMVVSLSMLGVPTAAATYYGSPKFQQLWQASEAISTNFWGPLGTAREPQLEAYAEGQATQPCPPGQACAQVIRPGQRLVQYFDKGRMELNQPDATVTSGLLASNLVHGQIQIGDTAFVSKPVPAIPIAGDPDNPGPTYAQLNAKSRELLDPAPQQTGATTQATLSAAGEITVSTVPASAPATFTVFDDTTKHNVPKAFADYRAKVNLLNVGFAVSEPFYANVKVGGTPKDVMIQVFERRVLTYTADNPDAFKVEMGNIGQHY